VRPAVIILFARAPLPGQVKTRLLTHLEPEQAAFLHKWFVRDTLEMLLALDDASDIELHTDTSTDAWTGVPVARFLQAPGGLGDRMLHAISAGLEAGRSRVTILGSDSPTLPASHLRKLLLSNGEVALGPVTDGGYYAISCRKAHPRMFAGVEFSTARTLGQTVEAVRSSGLSLELGEPWFDVDTPEDLEQLAQSANLPRHTAKYLGQLRLTR